MPKVKRLQESNRVTQRRKHHHDMHDLMAGPENVKRARKPLLGELDRVHDHADAITRHACHGGVCGAELHGCSLAGV